MSNRRPMNCETREGLVAGISVLEVVPATAALMIVGLLHGSTR